MFVIKKTDKEKHRKDLEKFLGVPLNRTNSNKKNLSSFLGVDPSELNKLVNSSMKGKEQIFGSECGEGSLSTETSTSTECSSLWSSF